MSMDSAKAVKYRNLTWLAVLLTMIACVLMMNYYCVPAQDEVAYATIGAIWSDEPIGRVSSFADIVRQQIGEYQGGGAGRIWLHSIVAFFSGFRLYAVFDVLNGRNLVFVVVDSKRRDNSVADVYNVIAFLLDIIGQECLMLERVQVDLPIVQSFAVDMEFLAEVLNESDFADVDMASMTVRPSKNWEKVGLYDVCEA